MNHVIGERCEASGGPVIYDITTTPPRPICPGCGAAVMVCNGVAGLHKVPLPRPPRASLPDRLRRGARDMRRAADQLEAIKGAPLTIRVVPDVDVVIAIIDRCVFDLGGTLDADYLCDALRAELSPGGAS